MEGLVDGGEVDGQTGRLMDYEYRGMDSRKSWPHII